MAERGDLTEELLDLLGEDGLFRLAEAHGGTRLYVPGNIDRSELPAQIGIDNAARLSNLFPGGYIRVPLARVLRAKRYRENGESNAQIARRLGLTEHGVQRLLSRQRKREGRPGKPSDDRQSDLFRR